MQWPSVSVFSGGRRNARRSVAWLAAAALVSFPAVGTAQTSPDPTVREASGVYFVSAVLSAAGPAAIALATLTDYEHIPQFMRAVKTSTVLERGDGHARVEQEAVASFLWFNRRIHLTLDIQEQPGTIHFTDRCGKSFERYEGTWTVTEREGRTTIGYELAAKPTFEVPEFLLKRLLKRDAQQMIAQLQTEIAARAARD